MPLRGSGRRVLRALARRLRRWTDSVLMDASVGGAEARPTSSGVDGPDSVDATATAERHARPVTGADPRAALAGEAVPGGTSSSTAPPAEWIQYIRERVPGLVLPSEGAERAPGARQGLFGEPSTPPGPRPDATVESPLSQDASRAGDLEDHVTTRAPSQRPTTRPEVGATAVPEGGALASSPAVPTAEQAAPPGPGDPRAVSTHPQAKKTPAISPARPANPPPSARAGRQSAPGLPTAEPRGRHEPREPGVERAAGPVRTASHAPANSQETLAPRPERGSASSPGPAAGSLRGAPGHRSEEREATVPRPHHEGEGAPESPGRAGWRPAPGVRRPTWPPIRPVVKSFLSRRDRPASHVIEPARPEDRSTTGEWSSPTPDRWPDLPEPMAPPAEDWTAIMRAIDRARRVELEHRGEV